MVKLGNSEEKEEKGVMRQKPEPITVKMIQCINYDIKTPQQMMVMMLVIRMTIRSTINIYIYYYSNKSMSDCNNMQFNTHI